MLITCLFTRFLVSLRHFLKTVPADIPENMIFFPNAKINLGLRVVERRPDGYHNLETVFYPIGLKDALEVVPYPSETDFSLSVSGLQFSSFNAEMEDNLVTKAFRLLQNRFELKPAACYLKKTIPTGAGLGGGSSDAAYALKIINILNDLGLSDGELEQISAHLGADCAFFIKNKPIFASGIGTDFEDIAFSLQGYFLILVKPDIHVSTAEAYSLVHPGRPLKPLKKLICKPVSTWKDTVTNDFEVSVFQRYPRIGSIKELLYSNGAVYASMSGSGSSVYGLFKAPVDLRPLFPDCFYWSEILS
jgi:4-diphosphocytidyl-2-C-methyl-D-erythritol kinase